jgi:hypothetical protein
VNELVIALVKKYKKGTLVLKILLYFLAYFMCNPVVGEVSVYGIPFIVLAIVLTLAGIALMYSSYINYKMKVYQFGDFFFGFMGFFFTGVALNKILF